MPKALRCCIYLAVDEQGDTVVGLAMGCPPTVAELENAGEVCQLYVRVDYQHQGLGRRLLQAVAGNLAQQGKRTLLIPVLAANAPARQFYEAMGGQLVGERDLADYGFILPEVVYGWPDLRTLAGEAIRQLQRINPDSAFSFVPVVLHSC